MTVQVGPDADEVYNGVPLFRFRTYNGLRFQLDRHVVDISYSDRTNERLCQRFWDALMRELTAPENSPAHFAKFNLDIGDHLRVYFGGIDYARHWGSNSAWIAVQHPRTFYDAHGKPVGPDEDRLLDAALGGRG